MRRKIIAQTLSLFCRHPRGATAIEYALIASFIAIAAIVAITATGSAVNASFNTTANQFH